MVLDFMMNAREKNHRNCWKFFGLGGRQHISFITVISTERSHAVEAPPCRFIRRGLNIALMTVCGTALAEVFKEEKFITIQWNDVQLF